MIRKFFVLTFFLFSMVSEAGTLMIFNPTDRYNSWDDAYVIELSDQGFHLEVPSINRHYYFDTTIKCYLGRVDQYCIRPNGYLLLNYQNVELERGVIYTF